MLEWRVFLTEQVQGQTRAIAGKLIKALVKTANQPADADASDAVENVSLDYEDFKSLARFITFLPQTDPADYMDPGEADGIPVYYYRRGSWRCYFTRDPVTRIAAALRIQHAGEDLSSPPAKEILLRVLRRFFRSQAVRYYAAMGASLLFSLVGIGWGVFISKNCMDGQRGGAVGVAMAFFILFLSRNYSQRVFDSVMELDPHLASRIASIVEEEASEPLSNEELTWMTIATIGRNNMAAKEQRRQNIALVVASIFSTLVWGFGDVVVGWFVKCHQ